MIVPLRKSSKLKHWPYGFGHSFSGTEKLGGTPEEWFLVNIKGIRKGRDNFYVIDLFMKRADGMETTQYIRSKDHIFIQELASRLGNYIGKSWEEIGDMEVED